MIERHQQSPKNPRTQLAGKFSPCPGALAASPRLRGEDWGEGLVPPRRKGFGFSQGRVLE